jgi:hypothetical protein
VESETNSLYLNLKVESCTSDALLFFLNQLSCRHNLRCVECEIILNEKRGNERGRDLLYFFLLLVGWDRVPRFCGHFWPILQPQMINEDDFWSNWWNEN